MLEIQELSDEELVEYVRSKDQEHYREIVARYQERLLRYANCLINDAEMAQDVVQQAFIKAFINLHGFNAGKKFSSWIYRIVHNEAINCLKQKKKEVPLDDAIRENVMDSSANDFEEILEKKEMKKLLADFLKELSIKYRAPLTLLYFENKSYEEISDILRIPVSTVGTRINRGKKQLKELFLTKKGKYYARK